MKLAESSSGLPLAIGILSIVSAVIGIVLTQYLPVDPTSHQVIPNADAASYTAMYLSPVNGTWSSGQKMSLTLIDSDANKSSRTREHLNSYDSHVDRIPSMKIGNPLTIESGNGPVAIFTSSGLHRESFGAVMDYSADAGISGRAMFETNDFVIHNNGSLIIDLHNNGENLLKTINNVTGSSNDFRGFNMFNYDLRSLTSLNGQANSPILNTRVFLVVNNDGNGIVDNIGNVINPASQLILLGSGDTHGLLFLNNNAMMKNQQPLTDLSNIKKTASIGLMFTFTTNGNDVDIENPYMPIIADFFSIGITSDGHTGDKRINNSIYRWNLEETGDDTSVFTGTMEYIILNQLNVFDQNTYNTLRTTDQDVKFAVIQDMRNSEARAPKISYLDYFDGVSAPISVQQDIRTHTGIATFDKKKYTVSDTVTITLWDKDLNVDNDLIDIYTSVSPSVHLETDTQDVAVDTIGSMGLGTNSDGSAFGKLFEIVFGDTDTRWSNAIIPDDSNHMSSCTFANGDVNTEDATTGGLAASLSATGFTLVETGPSTGIFDGTFEFPDEFCQNGTVTKTNGEIKLKYFDFADDSGKFNERDDYVGGFGFVDTLKIVPDFANFTKINQVGSLLPNETSVPVIVFFRNSSVINSGIAELTHLGATVNNDNIINIVPSVPADLPASVLDYVSNKYAVAIFRDSPVYPSSLDVDKKINATKVWPNFKGNHVTIAVLDMGIDSDHPEFSGATIVGCNNTMPSTDHDTCNDLGGHGTHVAGIALARSSTDDPNDPLRGVAPKASLMVIQMMGPDVGSGNAATAGKAIDWAVRNGTDVINMSFGEGTPGSNCDESGSVYRPYVIEAAQKGQGIPMIAASGNHNFTSIPACLRYVIAVGAVDDTGHLLSYTNPTDHSKNMDSGRGKAMEDHGLVAPGVNVLSTWPGGSSNVDSGTSMAAPAVAGTVALMLDKAHHTSTLLTPRAIEEILFRTACRTDSCIKPGMSTMSNEQFGHGLLNASAAVNLVGNTLFDLRETHMIMPSGVGDITIGNSADIPVIVLDSSNQAVTSGTVIYDDNRSGGTFLKDGVCTLTIDHQCKAEYKPASNGPITVSSLYIGDDAHDSTYGSVTVHVHSPVVPEFPSGLLIVMLVTFTTIVLFSKLRKFGKIFT